MATELQVQVNRKRLIETLEHNRQEHIKEYDEAAGLFAEAYLNKLGEMRVKSAEAKTPSEFPRYVDLEPPVSYEQSYTDAIELLELSEEDTVTLTASQHKQFVKDEWSWKRAFLSNSEFYKGQGRRR